MRDKKYIRDAQHMQAFIDYGRLYQAAVVQWAARYEDERIGGYLAKRNQLRAEAANGASNVDHITVMLG